MRKRKRSKKSWNKNKSPIGWYVASYVERFMVIGQDNNNPNNRFLTWENTILIRAANPELAYAKAVQQAKLGNKQFINTDGQRVKWKFEGLSSLLPVYEDFDDGSELIWSDYGMRALKRIRRLVKNKKELQVFAKDD